VPYAAKYLFWAISGFSVMSGCASLESNSPLAKLEKRLVYHPRKLPSAAESMAEQAGFEDIRFQSGDGTPLHGWFLDHPNPAAIALFCHGNAGSIANCGPGMKVLNERRGQPDRTGNLVGREGSKKMAGSAERCRRIGNRLNGPFAWRGGCH